MPIVIKAKKNDNNNDVIKQFKKAVVSTNIVQRVKDRRYYEKPSSKKAAYKISMNRLRRRARTLKKQKNISEEDIARINEKLGNS